MNFVALKIASNLITSFAYAMPHPEMRLECCVAITAEFQSVFEEDFSSFVIILEKGGKDCKYQQDLAELYHVVIVFFFQIYFLIKSFKTISLVLLWHLFMHGPYGHAFHLWRSDISSYRYCYELTR